jgi:hypothetical protein
MRPALCCDVLGLTEQAQLGEATVTTANMLLLAPWLIFFAALAVIGYRLSHPRTRLHRRRRHIR